MLPRPAGTDGTDHSYREIIVERYKRMAHYTVTVWRLLATSFFCMLVKCAWHVGLQQTKGLPIPNFLVAMMAFFLSAVAVLPQAKLGGAKESLRLLKVYNVLQALSGAMLVLEGWMYHSGTHSGGVPTYINAYAAASLAAPYLPGYSNAMLLTVAKTYELFQDCTTAVFLLMSILISHRMIVEKMEMKKDKDAGLGSGRPVAQQGGGDNGDDADAPDAVPLADAEERPRVARAAGGAKAAAVRRRHA